MIHASCKPIAEIFIIHALLLLNALSELVFFCFVFHWRIVSCYLVITSVFSRFCLKEHTRFYGFKIQNEQTISFSYASHQNELAILETNSFTPMMFLFSVIFQNITEMLLKINDTFEWMKWHRRWSRNGWKIKEKECELRWMKK